MKNEYKYTFSIEKHSFIMLLGISTVLVSGREQFRGFDHLQNVTLASTGFVKRCPDLSNCSGLLMEKTYH